MKQCICCGQFFAGWVDCEMCVSCENSEEEFLSEAEPEKTPCEELESCPRCGSLGYIYDFYMRQVSPCLDCKGTGQIPKSR